MLVDYYFVKGRRVGEKGDTGGLKADRNAKIAAIFFALFLFLFEHIYVKIMGTC